MSDIRKIDSNMVVNNVIDEGDLIFYSPLAEPFSVEGMLCEMPFRRMPEDAAKSVNGYVAELAECTAGGRIRFRTNSGRIVIRATTQTQFTFPHMTFIGTSGFDMYINLDGKKPIFAGTFMSEPSRGGTFECVLPNDCLEHEFTINLPLYDKVDALYIGLDRNATVNPPAPYRNERPIVFYGSSITQGGCASRPGNNYPAMISRRLNCDFIDLGFAGRAMGEDAMADYIASLPMELFVYDYDYNAPNDDHLKNTHERFFLRIREKNPDLPIIMSARPNWVWDRDGIEFNARRTEIVRRTYDNAIARGDKNVYYVNGHDMFGEAEKIGASPYDCTLEGCHPNDLGFACMAKTFGDKIAEVLKW